MTSTCIFADTLVRDHSEKCHEYYESIILEFPVSMAGLRLVFKALLRPLVIFRNDFRNRLVRSSKLITQ